MSSFLQLLGLVWDDEDPMTIVNKFYGFSFVEKHSYNRTISLLGIYSELKQVNVNESALNMKIVNYYK